MWNIFNNAHTALSTNTTLLVSSAFNKISDIIINNSEIIVASAVVASIAAKIYIANQVNIFEIYKTAVSSYNTFNKAIELIKTDFNKAQFDYAALISIAMTLKDAWDCAMNSDHKKSDNFHADNNADYVTTEQDFNAELSQLQINNIAYAMGY